MTVLVSGDFRSPYSYLASFGMVSGRASSGRWGRRRMACACRGAVMLCGGAAGVAGDALGGEGAAQPGPAERAVWCAGQAGGRDGQHGALGAGQAVAADPAAGDAGQGGAAAGADDEQVAGFAGDTGQDGPGFAALDDGLDQQAGGLRSSPGGIEGVSQPLPGVFGPDTVEVETRTAPAGEVTAWRYPCIDGNHGGVVDAGEVRGVAQCAQAAR